MHFDKLSIDHYYDAQYYHYLELSTSSKHLLTPCPQIVCYCENTKLHVQYTNCGYLLYVGKPLDE